MVSFVDAVIEHDVAFFDISDSYGVGQSEELLGRALRGQRDQVIVATKFGMDMQGANGDDGGRRGSSAYVRTAAEASLRRLGCFNLQAWQVVDAGWTARQADEARFVTAQNQRRSQRSSASSPA